SLISAAVPVDRVRGALAGRGQRRKSCRPEFSYPSSSTWRATFSRPTRRMSTFVAKLSLKAPMSRATSKMLSSSCSMRYQMPDPSLLQIERAVLRHLQRSMEQEHLAHARGVELLVLVVGEDPVSAVDVVGQGAEAHSRQSVEVQFAHDRPPVLVAVFVSVGDPPLRLTVSSIPAHIHPVTADPACEQAGPPTGAGVRQEGLRGWRRRRAADWARAGRGRIPSRSRWGCPPRRGSP